MRLVGTQANVISELTPNCPTFTRIAEATGYY